MLFYCEKCKKLIRILIKSRSKFFRFFYNGLADFIFNKGSAISLRGNIKNMTCFDKQYRCCFCCVLTAKKAGDKEEFARIQHE
jgi:hypothetical protein